MAQRSKSNWKAYKDTEITTNGAGAITGAKHNALLEDLADSVVFLDGSHTPPELYQVNVSSGDYIDAGLKVAYTSDTDRSMYRFIVYAGATASGNSDLNGNLLCPADSVTTMTFYCQGVAADGSEGISSMKVASFRRDGSADIVQIGATTSLHNVEDSGNTPTFTVSTTGSGPAYIRASYDSNSVTVYTWTIYADVSITNV